jgi:hypothetical protein
VGYEVLSDEAQTFLPATGIGAERMFFYNHSSGSSEQQVKMAALDRNHACATPKAPPSIRIRDHEHVTGGPFRSGVA